MRSPKLSMRRRRHPRASECTLEHDSPDDQDPCLWATELGADRPTRFIVTVTLHLSWLRRTKNCELFFISVLDQEEHGIFRFVRYDAYGIFRSNRYVCVRHF